MSIDESLSDEATAFDNRALERYKHGMVPDLRHAAPCDWFYNNPWRRPEFARMVFGRYLRFIQTHIAPPPARVLEIGCGPGHISLELARLGHHVTGVEISGESLNIARKTEAQRPRNPEFGSLTYVQSDILGFAPEHKFDAVVFVLVLHHFQDVHGVLSHVRSLMKPGGRVIVIEPARDMFSPLDAAVAALVRGLLTHGKSWHEEAPRPITEGAFGREVEAVLMEYREARDRHESLQSPHDNDAAAGSMLSALEALFTPVSYEPAHAIVPRIVGGVRGSEEEVLLTARFIEAFDDYCVRRGLLQPGAFMCAGQVPDP